MNYYLRNGNTFRPTAKENLDLHESLPPGNYIIKRDQFGNWFFETTDDFAVPAKLYGGTPRHTDRILNTFLSRDNSTGVMLAGEKGSGKSLLAKAVSLTGAERHNLPTIIINTAWHGDAFNTLIQSIQQPAILLFDEFEKVYNREEQEAILTLLDGVFPSKKLFVFTCNDKWRVDQHMRNRPGRIFYMIDFSGLEEDFVREYCEDNLSNKTHIEAVCRLVKIFSQFNFDMLKALVEEMNRYDEAPAAALEMLNVRPEFEAGKPLWFYTLSMNGETVSSKRHYRFRGNPLTDMVDVYFSIETTADDGTVSEEDHNIEFNPEDMVSLMGDVYTFEKDGVTMVMTRQPETRAPNWREAF